MIEEDIYWEKVEDFKRDREYHGRIRFRDGFSYGLLAGIMVGLIIIGLLTN